MIFENIDYQITAIVTFYKDFDFQNLYKNVNYFGCPVSINEKSTKEGWDVRIRISDNLSIKKGIPYELLIVFLFPDKVKDKISINTKLFLWSGDFIGEAIVIKIKGV